MPALADGSPWLPQRTASDLAEGLAAACPEYARQFREAARDGFHILLPELASLLQSRPGASPATAAAILHVLEREVGDKAAPSELANALEISFLKPTEFTVLLGAFEPDQFPHLRGIAEAGVRRAR